VDLENLLSSLKEEGSLDSRGRFTLDTRLMLEKLSRFQFGDRQTYLLPLLGGLAAQGATSIEVATTRQHLTVRARCRGLTKEQLHHLWDELANPSSTEANRDFALGLFGATREFKALTLFSREGERTHFWVYNGEREQIEVRSLGSSPAGPDVWLQGEHRTPWWQRVLGLAGKPLSLDRFRHAPFEVTLKGRSVRRPFDLATCRITACIGPELPGHELCQQRREGMVRALLGLGADEPGLHLLRHGVLYKSLRELPYRGLALVEANHLTPDLSYSALVENDDFRALVEELERELERSLLHEVRQQGAGRGTARQVWLQEVLIRRKHELPDELLTLELLRTVQGQRKPISLALRQQEAHGCVLVGQPGMPASYHGRFVFGRTAEHGWMLDALPVELVELTRTEDGRVVPARLLLDEEVALPQATADSHWVTRQFVSDEGRGAAGIPRSPCPSTALLTLYVGGNLTQGKPDLLPPGLELVFDRPSTVPTVPTAQELGSELAPLYRQLLEEHRPEGEVLTHILAWLATAARIFNQLRKSITTLEARLAKKPDKGIALGQLGRGLLMMTPIEAMLIPPGTVPDYVLPQLSRLATATDLRHFCTLPLLRRVNGSRLSVLDIALEKSLYCDPERADDETPREAFLLTTQQAGLLAELLGPGRLKRV